jgi:hypothetical protein
VSDDLSIPTPTYRIPRHRRAMDPGTKRLALIAGGLGATLLVVVGGWELIGHRSTAVPVVQADSRPIKVKPDNPGGLQVAGADEDILSGAAASKEGKLAPAPEAPAPQALRSPPAPASGVAPSATPAPQQAAAPAPAKPVAAKPAAAPEKHPAPPAAGGAQVQLAAVSSEEAAKSEWQRLSKRMPDLLGQRRPAFSKTEHDGRTLWRVRAGGFADVPQATSFCEKVRAKGVGCSVAEF